MCYALEKNKLTQINEDSQATLCQLATHLYVLNNIFERRGPLHACVHHVHCPVEVLYIFSIHLQKRRQLLQDISQPWVDIPMGKSQVSTDISGNQYYLQRENTALRLSQLSLTCTSTYPQETKVFQSKFSLK